jgi:hypothetical protein
VKITAETRSDQWNADDLISGPRTFTIAGARKGAAEQPYDIVFEGEEKVWRPPVTVRKILTTAWGNESDDWVGRRVTLFRDPSIRFGPNQVGGIRVSHMSGIDAPVKAVLNTTRGKRALHTVEPLPDAKVTPTDTSAPSPAQVAASTDQAELREWWGQYPSLRALIEARVAELKGADQ